MEKAKYEAFKSDIVGPQFFEEIELCLPLTTWEEYLFQCDEEEICEYKTLILLMRRYRDGNIPEISHSEMEEYQRSVFYGLGEFLSAARHNSPCLTVPAWSRVCMHLPNKLHADFFSKVFGQGYYPDLVIGILIHKYTKKEIDPVTTEEIDDYIKIINDQNEIEVASWFYLKECYISLGIVPDDE